MRIILSLFLVFSLFSCTNNQSLEISFIAKTSNPEKVFITSPSEYIEIKLDEFGMASKEVKFDKSCIATVLCGDASFNIFLSDKRDISIVIEEVDGKFDFSVKCDDGGINDYLINDIKKSKSTLYSNYKLSEKEFFSKVSNRIKAEEEAAQKLQFPNDFKLLNIERIKYDALYSSSIYPLLHSYATGNEEYLPTKDYFSFVNKYYKEKPELFGLLSYISYMDNIAVSIANKSNIDWGSRAFTLNSLSYVNDSINNKSLKEILTTKRVKYFIKSSGIKNSEEILKFFNRNVHKSIYRNEIQSIIEEWKKLGKGKPAYPFTCKDINGKEVSIDMLGGKYSYICVWTSWCAPCNDEMPIFQKLRNEFADKNIQFICISCDQSKLMWKHKVLSDKLGGLQLHFGGDEKFLEKYIIYSIPRFILLDKDTNIIDAHALKPSNDGIRELLNSL